MEENIFMEFNFITAEQQQFLVSEASFAEQIGQLTPKQLDFIHQKNWFNMFVPSRYGGLGYNMMEGLKLEEELAYLDGSLGWTVTLCAGASWFKGFLSDEALAQWSAQVNLCVGGSGMASGTAQLTGDSYKINGEWNYATGSPHNTFFTANCLILNEHGQSIVENGEPKFQSFYFTREEVEIIDNWSAMGLKATASQGFRVKNLEVPSYRSFSLNLGAQRMEDIIFYIPFDVFAYLTLAANYLGQFSHFFDLAFCSAEDKRFIDDWRNELFLQASLIDQQVKAGVKFDEFVHKELLKACKKRVDDAYFRIHQQFPLLGMRAVNEQEEINRVWKDLYTARQHVIFR